jgi:hypothetical protein
MNNYMAQDILGITLAVILFPVVLIAPGYIALRAFDLLDFRNRKFPSRMAAALLVSSAISPCIFFLTDRLISRQATLIVAGLLFAVFIFLLLHDWKGNQFSKADPVHLKWLYIISGGWVAFAIVFLTDIQWGNRLYYNIAGFDYSTRAAVINAITRTGVPPINPGYFPGQPQRLTFLYYFWYVLCSIIDQLGGRLVDARMSLMASIIWTGLALISAVGIYIQIRHPYTDRQAIWKKIKIGIGFLLVSGLDIFPVALFLLLPQLLSGRMLDGDIEQWNEQITAWIGSVTWTPHHVISVLACLTAWMLIASNRDRGLAQQLGAVLISGLALASAAGLSIWVTLVFVLFWFVWLIARIASKESIRTLWMMVAPGLIAGIAILPFLLDLLGGSTGSATGSQFPLTFRVREFFPFEILTIHSPAWETDLINFAALPLNYFLELGFFSMVGILWFRYCRKQQSQINEFVSSEILLFLLTLFVVTFVRSIVITHNDFGWRGWMFAQFILLIWAVDLVELFWGEKAPDQVYILNRPRKIDAVRKTLLTLIILGISTSVVDAVTLRLWPMVIDTGILGFPRIISRDAHLGERALAARETFSYLDKHLAPNAIVQFSPAHLVDTLSSLYRTNSAIISYSTLYGVGPEEYEPLIAKIQNIFDSSSMAWDALDTACQKNQINVLIVRDFDPIWKDLPSLAAARQPLYSNSYFAAFTCGH